PPHSAPTSTHRSAYHARQRGSNGRRRALIQTLTRRQPFTISNARLFEPERERAEPRATPRTRPAAGTRCSTNSLSSRRRRPLRRRPLRWAPRCQGLSLPTFPPRTGSTSSTTRARPHGRRPLHTGRTLGRILSAARRLAPGTDRHGAQKVSSRRREVPFARSAWRRLQSPPHGGLSSQRAMMGGWTPTFARQRAR